MQAEVNVARRPRRKGERGGERGKAGLRRGGGPL